MRLSFRGYVRGSLARTQEVFPAPPPRRVRVGNEGPARVDDIVLRVTVPDGSLSDEVSVGTLWPGEHVVVALGVDPAHPALDGWVHFHASGQEARLMARSRLTIVPVLESNDRG